MDTGTIALCTGTVDYCEIGQERERERAGSEDRTKQSALAIVTFPSSKSLTCRLPFYHTGAETEYVSKASIEGTQQEAACHQGA